MPKPTDDLELLTKGRDVLSADNFSLLKSTWYTSHCASGSGGCVLGAGLHAFALSPQDFYGEPRSISQWDLKGEVQTRLAELLVPHLDLALAAEVLPTQPIGEHYRAEELVVSPRFTAVDIITIYSDYVLVGLLDGKERAIKLYDAAIAAELAKRVEVRAGADA